MRASLTRVAGWNLRGVLGEGAMATVYRGESDAGGDAVAIKVLSEALTRDAEAVRRFQHEVRNASRLSHPGIVRVIQAGTEDGVPYLAMELLEGDLLAQCVRPMSSRAAWELMRPVFEAVAHAHQEGVLHRDLNPKNVMVTPIGVKVLDFGLARSARDTTLTGPGTPLGTIAYMAPEQAAGERVTAAADQYALAVMLFELLSATRPFDEGEGSNLARWMRRLTAAPRRLREVMPDASEALDAVLARMLAPAPSDRFSSVEEARQALDEAVG